jgi:phosphoribosylformylglycinamidine cyclo-ligase
VKFAGSACFISFNFDPAPKRRQSLQKAEPKNMRYSDAGVNITVADQAKRRIAAMAGKTFRRGVLTPVGGFGALFQLDRKRWRKPILVSSADGVGTKLKIAFATGIHSGVGADILNHCVNDILTQGAEPLFFLDYLAMGKLDTAIIEQVIEGMSRAAKRAGCSLIGGETAEMPDFYAPGEYDLAGFIVGAVEEKMQLDPRRVRPGDALIALPSSGLHTNGYSLARKLIFGEARLKPDTYVADVGNKIGAELLKAHRPYWPLLKDILAKRWVTSMAHITGGGITGNLPRALPANVQAVIDLGSWPVLPIFRYLAQLGKIERDELLQTFNMGVGMILVVPATNVARVEAELRRRREKFYLIGRIERAVRGKSRVNYTGQLAL